MARTEGHQLKEPTKNEYPLCKRLDRAGFVAWKILQDSDFFLAVNIKGRVREAAF
jgi:hypothetical protein